VKWLPLALAWQARQVVELLPDSRRVAAALKSCHFPSPYLLVVVVLAARRAHDARCVGS
jgi:hypothetical protein